jgi:hypothetical protein
MGLKITYDSILEFSEEIQSKEGWNHLKGYLRGLTTRDAMTSLGMKELYCSWLDLDEVLRCIEDWMNFAIGVTAAYSGTLEIIESRLREGYSTHDLDIDTLIPTRGIMLIPTILECRKKEVETAALFFTSAGNRINVRNLKRTYYGMMMLRQMPFVRFTRRVSKEEFNIIKIALAKLSLEVQEPQHKS